jgi:sulfonate transport system substrate-binding protein
MNGTNRWRTRLLAVAAMLGVLTVAAADAADRTVRVGYQKYGTFLLLKARGLLERRLAPLGYAVSWTEFPGGPQLLEALNVGALDFGVTGEAPPIFAQAAGAPLVYVGDEPPAPRSEAILVAKDSPLHQVTDLKGKSVALNKGSNVHYLLVRALEKAGLQYSDVKTVFLAPADARAAFEHGSVDAWAIWDPFQASAELGLEAHTLANGEGGVAANRQFYIRQSSQLCSPRSVRSTNSRGTTSTRRPMSLARPSAFRRLFSSSRSADSPGVFRQ